MISWVVLSDQFQIEVKCNNISMSYVLNFVLYKRGQDNPI